MKKAALHNLGCKVNAYETDIMEQQLRKSGYEIVPFSQKADVYIINTCAVTNMADRKSRQMLHRAKKLNPDSIVVAAGCYVQEKKEELLSDLAVDILLGNNRKNQLISLLEKYEKQKKIPIADVVEINKEQEYEPMILERITNHTRAFVKIQDGCNQFCTYCIIPYVRGRIRSKAMEEIVKEVKGLGERGFKEIVLTGIHLSSYGKEQTDSKKKAVDLCDVLEQIHDIEGIERIRLGSLEPGIITTEFLDRISTLKKICPHFHLSLQSGCDRTLKRMNRKYTSAQYEEKCQLIRQYFKMPAITTDVIVGFPEEDEDEFAITKEFLERIQLAEIHIFQYSKREGTLAAKMKQVLDTKKASRSEELFALNQKMAKKFKQRFIGEEVEVLFEEAVEKNGSFYQVGHTPEYIKVAVKTKENLSNQIAKVKIKGFLEEEILLAELENIV